MLQQEASHRETKPAQSLSVVLPQSATCYCAHWRNASIQRSHYLHQQQGLIHRETSVTLPHCHNAIHWWQFVEAEMPVDLPDAHEIMYTPESDLLPTQRAVH